MRDKKSDKQQNSYERPGNTSVYSKPEIQEYAQALVAAILYEHYFKLKKMGPFHAEDNPFLNPVSILMGMYAMRDKGVFGNYAQPNDKNPIRKYAQPNADYSSKGNNSKSTKGSKAA